MCYPCTQCGRCGKFDENSPLYQAPPATIPCFVCGGEVDLATGICLQCGDVAFVPVGQEAAGGSDEGGTEADEPCGASGGTGRSQ